MKICVIGTGYVGLVTAACLTHLQHEVVCVDNAKEKIATLDSGGLPLWENGLEQLLQDARAESLISFTTNLSQAVAASEVLIIAVGTPSQPNGDANLNPLWDVVRQIAQLVPAGRSTGKLLIIKSTVPVGTCDLIAEYLLSQDVSISDVVHNPEFLRQGSAVYDFFHPDRIVAGFANNETPLILNRLFQGLDVAIQLSSRKSAELIKYAANAFLAMKISYINMMADLSEKLGTNIDDIAKGIGADHRIGPAFLQAGVGYGGSCFPKDLRALQFIGKAVDCVLPLLQATESINQARPQQIMTKLKQQLGSLKGKRITLLGLSFKPMTDDIREAASIEISRLCIEEEAYVAGYDPIVHDIFVKGAAVFTNPYSAIENSDAVVLLTEWDAIRELDWIRIMKLMNHPLLIDCRNMLNWREMEQLSHSYEFIYISTGRPMINSLLHKNLTSQIPLEV